MDTWLVVVTALLAVSTLIAPLGLVNTLTLSAVERRRESAVLRALGTSQLQPAATVRETVLASLVAAPPGVLLVIGYGLAGVHAVLGPFNVAVPWGQLSGLIAAAAAGVLASLVPAWRTTWGPVSAGLAG